MTRTLTEAEVRTRLSLSPAFAVTITGSGVRVSRGCSWIRYNLKLEPVSAYYIDPEEVSRE